MIYRFEIQGSAPQPYQVAFEKIGPNLRAACTCPAGKKGTHCKHRIDLLNGVINGLVSDNANEVSILKELLVGTDVEAALREVDASEKDLSAVKKRLSKAKKSLATAMNH